MKTEEKVTKMEKDSLEAREWSSKLHILETAGGCSFATLFHIGRDFLLDSMDQLLQADISSQDGLHSIEQKRRKTVWDYF